MIRFFAVLTLVVAGAISLAFLAISVPLLAALRPPVHAPRAEDLGYDDDDPGRDVDSD